MTNEEDCRRMILVYCDGYRSKNQILDVVGFWHPEKMIHQQVLELMGQKKLQKHPGHQRGFMVKYRRVS